MHVWVNWAAIWHSLVKRFRERRTETWARAEMALAWRVRAISWGNLTVREALIAGRREVLLMVGLEEDEQGVV